MATCPECDAQVELGADVEEGEIVVCGDCGAELEVTGVSPVKLDLAAFLWPHLETHLPPY